MKISWKLDSGGTMFEVTVYDGDLVGVTSLPGDAGALSTLREVRHILSSLERRRTNACPEVGDMVVELAMPKPTMVLSVDKHEELVWTSHHPGAFKWADGLLGYAP